MNIDGHSADGRDHRIQGRRWAEAFRDPVRSSTVWCLAVLLSTATVWALSSDIEKSLTDSTYVYISSTRKDGSLGKAAEIWFFYHQGAVYVGTSPDSWRVRRIRWGRPKAKIWVGKTDGPAFEATGEVVDDDATEALLMKTFAEKYQGGWKRYEENFRKGFADGTRVLVKYTPVAGGD